MGNNFFLASMLLPYSDAHEHIQFEPLLWLGLQLIVIFIID